MPPKKAKRTALAAKSSNVAKKTPTASQKCLSTPFWGLRFIVLASLDTKPHQLPLSFGHYTCDRKFTQSYRTLDAYHSRQQIRSVVNMPPKKAKRTALAAKSSNVAKKTPTASQKKSGITQAKGTPSKAKSSVDQHTTREQSPIEDSITLQSGVEESIVGTSALSEIDAKELTDAPMDAHDVVKSDSLITLKSSAIQMSTGQPPKGTGNKSRKVRAYPAKKQPVSKRSNSVSSVLEAATGVAAPKKKCKVESATAELSKTSFLDLPAEIRVMIYQYAAANESSGLVFVRRARLQQSRRQIQRRGTNKSDYFVKCGGKDFRTTYRATVPGYCVHNQWRPFKLMWVCALIRKEVIPIIFAEWYFSFRGIDVVQPFLRDLTEDQLRSIRRIHIECGGSLEIHRDWLDLRVETFGYLVSNVDLESLRVEVKDDDLWDYCPCCEGGDIFAFDLEDPDWKWVQKLCELKNLESIFVNILNFDPDRGYEAWLNGPDDVDDESSDAVYDGSLDWLPVGMMSEDVEWTVAESVLKPAAWERRKTLNSCVWKDIQEHRIRLAEARVITEAEMEAELEMEAQMEAEMEAEMETEIRAEIDSNLVAEMAAEEAGRKAFAARVKCGFEKLD